MFIKVVFIFIGLVGYYDTENCLKDLGIIHLEHLGDVDKPYYKISFYLEGSKIDTTRRNHFFQFIKVTNNEFGIIKEAIESCSFEGKIQVADGSYCFSIKDDKINKIISTEYIEPIRTIFHKIHLALGDIAVKNRIKMIFNQTLRRLGDSNNEID